MRLAVLGLGTSSVRARVYTENDAGVARRFAAVANLLPGVTEVVATGAALEGLRPITRVLGTKRHIFAPGHGNDISIGE